MESQLDKTERIVMLMDYYGNLLTPKQLEYMQFYYEEDLSLAEIAEEFNISRNAVFDQIKRATAMLEEYEEKLQLLDKHAERLKLLEKLQSFTDENKDQIIEYLDMLKKI